MQRLQTYTINSSSRSTRLVSRWAAAREKHLALSQSIYLPENSSSTCAAPDGASPQPHYHTQATAQREQLADYLSNV
uniref:Uncharacterized protein n=1 Tax=Trichogramma kaykai TaxID=54128 RepID=A0ABD2X4S1_9HYME